MSILTMARADADGNYPEGAYADIYWSRNARGGSEIMPIIMHETHIGLVLSTGENNGYDDSDFYAIVWDDEKGQPERIVYASTRGWSYPNNATVDATEEIKAKYEAWSSASIARQRASKVAQELATPHVGKTVEITGGRKLSIGTQAIVGWYGRDRFDRSGQYRRGPTLNDVGIYDPTARAQKDGFRVGLRVEGYDKLVFVNAMHVRVIGAVVDESRAA